MNSEDTTTPSARALLWLFVVALAVRVLYALAIDAFAGAEGLKGPDSHGYLLLARGFADAVATGKVAG